MISITLLSAASGHDEQGRILLALAFVLVGAKLAKLLEFDPRPGRA